MSSTLMMLVGAAACATPTVPIAPITSGALRLEKPLPAPGASALRAGLIVLPGSPLLFQVPASAVSGRPFDVSVTTYGGGCIGEDTTLVDAGDHGADVVPYQRVYGPRPNVGCTLELRVTRRIVQVLIGQPGEATLRVIGRAAPGDSLVAAERKDQHPVGASDASSGG